MNAVRRKNLNLTVIYIYYIPTIEIESLDKNRRKPVRITPIFNSLCSMDSKQSNQSIS